jgi:hypothetical protein
MAEIAVTVGVLVVGIAGWYALWRRRVASALERVPVCTGRTPPPDRQPPDFSDHSR